MAEAERDQVSGTETTGHEWDGIKELNTPLPKWWLWTFYATIVWALIYTILYPAWPLVSSATKGVLGYSSRAQVAANIATAKAAQGQYLDQIAVRSLEDIRADQSLFEFALAGGRSAFAVNCSPCHGSGAQGGRGFPNLNDDDWLWGGSLEDIDTSIRHGIRYAGDDDTRISEMPAFGRDGLLQPAQIADVAQFVLSLSGKDHDSDAAIRGVQIFTANCATCHGATGGGDRNQGAPALNDAIWLYGDTAEAIVRQVTNPHHGVMPAWAKRLDDTVIKQLALYVHSLGGGE
jgi:cytochrome c oxidase cbb3-type subunit III